MKIVLDTNVFISGIFNGDAAFIARGLGDIARAKGMSQVARDACISVKGFGHE